jgi:hypothetical protein
MDDQGERLGRDIVCESEGVHELCSLKHFREIASSIGCVYLFSFQSNMLLNGMSKFLKSINSKILESEKNYKFIT